MKTTAIAAAFAATLTAAAPASAAEWVPLSTNSDETMLYSGKEGSQKFVKIGPDDAITLIVRIDKKGTKTPKFYRFGIKAKACKEGAGSLHVYDLNDEPLDNPDYVSEGGTVASQLGDTLCELARLEIAERQQKAQPKSASTRNANEI
jgi:hypothetical protein